MLDLILPRVSRRFLAALGVALVVLGPLTQVRGQISSTNSAVPDRILARIDESKRLTVSGSTHPAVRHAIDKGRLAGTTPMNDLVLVLNRSAEQQVQLKALNEGQYDPASPEYHQWLTPQQFGASYGVSQGDLTTVTTWLEEHGFTIQEIAPSRTSIRFSGNAALVESAFHTEMHAIELHGVSHIANTSDIQIPAALGAVVAGVKSLHNIFPTAQHHTGPMLSRNAGGSWTPAGTDAAKSGPATTAANAQPEYTSSGYQLLVPYDMATIYNYKSLWTASTPITGSGQTIAIAGTSNIVLSDIATFRSVTGLPASTPRVIITNVDPGTTSLLDDRMENTLDVEWSGAAAPGASIVLVTSSQTSPSTDPLYLSESYIINNNIAKIMSVSYGECELGMGTAGNQEYLNLWQQAYSQGIAVFVSTGDSLAAVCDDGDYNPSADYATEYGLSVSGMASTPYNVAVGGTDFNWTSVNFSSTNSSANMSNAVGYIPEVPWNDTVANPILVSDLNSQYGKNYTAEGWANYLLRTDGISNAMYEDVIPAVGGSGGVSGCTTSSGGTPSTCSGGYAKPSWQSGVTGIVTSDKRTVPDVSFFASNGFLGVAYLICDTLPPGYSSTISCSYPGNALSMAVGGTSVSSPVMAGVMALINQKAGASQGNPNAVLYGLAARQTYGNCSAQTVTNSSACYFNDINTGNIEAPCFVGSINCTAQTQGDALGILPGYAATTGYDKATGLGSLNVANVVNGWPGTSAITLTPTTLTFATTNVNVSATALTVTLKNTGTGALTLSAVAVTGPDASSFSQSNSCPATLAANASCTISVVFKPVAIGALAASLSFTDNAPNSPQTVALTGTAIAPVVSLGPSSLTFGSTVINTSSVAQTITLQNTGSAALALSSIAVGGTNSTSFLETTTCGATVAINGSCTVSVTFKPVVAGALSATLTFTDNAATPTQTLILTGSATAVPAPAVTLTPTAVNFATTNVNTASAAQVVTLKNTGTLTLTVSSITLSGANPTSFSETTTCGATVAVNATCTVAVTFKPTAVGALSAILNFADNAANSPQPVPLTGTGLGVPIATVTPASLTFPSTNAGTSTTAQLVTIKNTGTAPLTIASITIGGNNPVSFPASSACPASLAINASCTVSILFAPVVSAPLSATLAVADNAANSPQTVTLTGVGTGAPSVALSASTLTFSATAVGAASNPSYSAAQTVTLTNTGNAPLVIASVSLSGSSPKAFSAVTNCPASLAASASCVTLVRFAPSAAGSQAATLFFTDNASSGTQAVSLIGTGANLPSISLSATAVSFGSVTTGTTSTTQTITLTNTTNGSPLSAAAPLNLTSIAVTGTGAASFVEVNNCPASLAAGSSCVLLVQFAPTTKGAAVGTLTIAANNPSATATAALTGTGQ